MRRHVVILLLVLGLVPALEVLAHASHLLQHAAHAVEHVLGSTDDADEGHHPISEGDHGCASACHAPGGAVLGQPQPRVHAFAGPDRTPLDVAGRRATNLATQRHAAPPLRPPIR
ncbi:MAG: hypothetical protein R2939_08485 [Kofleriaceae bacterium]